MSPQHRGTGGVYRPSYRDKRTGILKTASVWWIRYGYRGNVVRESSGSENRVDAIKLLKRRLGEIGRGGLTGPNVERTTFRDLVTMLADDYRANGRKSLPRVQAAIEHLRAYFAEHRAVEITSDRVTAYVRTRQVEGAASATINRELAALKRMLRLGERADKVAQRPYIAMLRENNTRKGFFEEADFRAVLTELPDSLKPLFETAYLTGWRVKSELVTRRWSHVDFQGGWLRLEPGETKNGEGRMYPLTGRLRIILEQQRAWTETLQRESEQIIPLIFHRSGRPIKSYRRAWISACRKAGLTGRIPHDFRRTALRNLERAGVPRSTAMKMVGHRTESVYRRYAIADEGMLKEGAAKLDTFYKTNAQSRRVVVAFQGSLPAEKQQSNSKVDRVRGRNAETETPLSGCQDRKDMVGWDGIEPPTPGFSVPQEIAA